MKESLSGGDGAEMGQEWEKERLNHSVVSDLAMRVTTGFSRPNDQAELRLRNLLVQCINKFSPFFWI